jgi:hypothetical protein
MAYWRIVFSDHVCDGLHVPLRMPIYAALEPIKFPRERRPKRSLGETSVLHFSDSVIDLTVGADSLRKLEGVTELGTSSATRVSRRRTRLDAEQSLEEDRAAVRRPPHRYLRYRRHDATGATRRSRQPFMPIIADGGCASLATGNASETCWPEQPSRKHGLSTCGVWALRNEVRQHSVPLDERGVCVSIT